eukprot:GFYU01006819.1.p1 GENE.GFYU01006819.1~~GFYU01006819.1.p1  ORF type:complete len:207 (+),score=37.74 GFYU01006819.1:132-752(+)
MSFLESISTWLGYGEKTPEDQRNGLARDTTSASDDPNQSEIEHQLYEAYVAAAREDVLAVDIAEDQIDAALAQYEDCAQAMRDKLQLLTNQTNMYKEQLEKLGASGELTEEDDTHRDLIQYTLDFEMPSVLEQLQQQLKEYESKISILKEKQTALSERKREVNEHVKDGMEMNELTGFNNVEEGRTIRDIAAQYQLEGQGTIVQGF